MELKTNRLLEHPRAVASFERYKMLKLWGQSFPVGVQKIVIGFRDDHGNCTKVGPFDVGSNTSTLDSPKAQTHVLREGLGLRVQTPRL